MNLKEFTGEQYQQFAIFALQGLFLLTAIITGFQGNFETMFISILGFLLIFLPLIIEKSLKIDLPVAYELLIAVFIFATVFMGEIGDAYNKFWWWDIVLHASSGVLLGYVGFLVLYVLYRQKKLIASASLVAFFTLVTGLASAGVWEIFEFAADMLLGTSMQRGAVDTMSDIIVASIGSVIAAVVAYVHIKWPQRSLFRSFIKDFFDSNPTYKRATSRKGDSNDS
jgi:hypothetical protein